MATFDPRTEDPESYKRKRSGFWDYQFDQFAQRETWTCDKRKLNDEVSRAMLDPSFAREFHTQGPGILDKLFGRGTAEAFSYRTKGDQDRVAMQFNEEMLRDRQMGSLHRKQNDMALGYGYLTGGTSTSGTTFTNATASATDYWIRDEIVRQEKRMMKDMINKTPPPKMPKFTRRLVKNLPFVNGGDGLVETLQREFDHWAKPQMDLVRG